MKAQDVINHFQNGIKEGWLAANDDIYIDWWSVEDVDTFDDHNLTADQKRTIWTKVMVQLERAETVDSDFVRQLIDWQIEETLPTTTETDNA